MKGQVGESHMLLLVVPLGNSKSVTFLSQSNCLPSTCQWIILWRLIHAYIVLGIYGVNFAVITTRINWFVINQSLDLSEDGNLVQTILFHTYFIKVE